MKAQTNRMIIIATGLPSAGAPRALIIKTHKMLIIWSLY